MRQLSKKRIALLGATGSIGIQTLDVLERLGCDNVVLMSAGSNWQVLAKLANKWKPSVVTLADETYASPLKESLTYSSVKILCGEDAVAQMSKEMDYDLCINGLVGISGLLPSFNSLSRGIPLALANKESMVLAGDLLNKISDETGAEIFPIDSEHSAIQQCLQGEELSDVKSLILTASGGPFLNWSPDRIKNATIEEALAHPTWKMGPKISIDSATLMNKGLEVIEAKHLFRIDVSKIEVRIHPVSFVHSMVLFKDGSFKAQLGVPDMRIPIQYALTYPHHCTLELLEDDPINWPPLEFFEVENDKFPCLGICFEALEIGGTATAALNGADEAAVAAFLRGKISFGSISHVIKEAVDNHCMGNADTIEKIVKADRWGREFVNRIVGKGM